MSARTVHACAVAFGRDGGVLIEGPSGSGKSALALALVDCGALLVADDRTVVFARDGSLYARAPRAIAGLIEVRGLGVMRLPALRLARIRLVLGLGSAMPPRLPEPATCIRLGCELPFLAAVAGSAAFAAGLARALAGRPDPDRTAI